MSPSPSENPRWRSPTDAYKAPNENSRWMSLSSSENSRWISPSHAYQRRVTIRDGFRLHPMRISDGFHLQMRTQRPSKSATDVSFIQRKSAMDFSFIRVPTLRDSQHWIFFHRKHTKCRPQRMAHQRTFFYLQARTLQSSCLPRLPSTHGPHIPPRHVSSRHVTSRPPVRPVLSRPVPPRPANPRK